MRQIQVNPTLEVCDVPELGILDYACESGEGHGCALRGNHCMGFEERADTTSTDAVLLEDIAEELSAVEDWAERLLRVLWLIHKAHRADVVSLAIRVHDWKFLCVPMGCASGEEALLLRDYTVFSGDSDTREDTLALESSGSFISLPLGGIRGVIGVLRVSSDVEAAFCVSDVSAISKAAAMLGAFVTTVAFQARELETDRVQNILESIIDGFLAIDYNATVTLLNRRAEEMLGLRRGETVGRDIWSIFPRESVFVRAYEQVMNTRLPFSVEDEYVELGAWFELHAYPSREGVSTYFRDISDRRRMVSDLDVQARRLQAVLDALPVGVFIADVSGRIVQTNSLVDDIWGGSAPRPRFVEEYSAYKGWWPETGERVKAEDWALARAVLKGETSVGEVIDIECFDGARGTILNSAAPITDENGRVIGGVAAIQDISLQRQMEIRAAEHAATLRTVLHTIPVGVVIADAKTDAVTYYNAATMEIAGGPVPGSAAVTALKGYALLRPDGTLFAIEELPLIRSLRKAEKATGVEMLIRRGDGSEVSILVNSAPVTDASGNVTSAVVTMDDITELVTLRLNLEKLLQESQKETRRLAAMADMAAVATSLMDLPGMLDIYVSKIAEGLEADGGCIYLFDEVSRQLVARSISNVPELLGVHVESVESVIWKMGTGRRTLSLTNPKQLDDDARGRGVMAILGTPMISRNRLLGVVSVEFHAPRAFDIDDIRFIETTADRTASVIENARLYEDLSRSRSDIAEALERERHFSLILQRALLPEQPSIGGGYRVAVKYVPAYADREIGGDFYDAFDVSDGMSGVLIGDVAGKGFEAAALAATTRTTIHTLAHQTSDVGDVLTRANAVLYSHYVEMTSFVTVFFAMVNQSSGMVNYANAGHLSPILRRADGGISVVNHGKFPLRVMPDATYTAGTLVMSPGDKIIMYTDGITEARRGREMFDFDRLMDIVKERGDLSVECLANQILSAAVDWAEGRLADDAAVVILSRE